MSSNKVSATFRSINSEAINAEGEVVVLSELGKDLNKYFDLLIQVEWLTGPKKGEKGPLLCSHYCRWPESLKSQAVFLEGCFTPVEYATDSRLVLGYHPGTVTSYEWEKEGEVVKIVTSLVEGAEDNIPVSATFQRGEGVVNPTCRGFRRLLRVWGLYRQDAMNNEERPLSLEEAYSSFEQRFINGELPVQVSPFLFSYLLGSIEDAGVYANGSLSTTLSEYGENCEVNGNTVTVINSNEEGFMIAEPVALPMSWKEEGLTVIRRMDSQGFIPAVSLPLQEMLDEDAYLDGDYGQDLHIGWEVEQSFPEHGYMKAMDIHSPMYMGEVIRDIPEEGYLKAWNIESDPLNEETVLYPCKGYLPAEELPFDSLIMRGRRRRGNDTFEYLSVSRDIPEYGWAKAEALTNH